MRLSNDHEYLEYFSEKIYKKIEKDEKFLLCEEIEVICTELRAKIKLITYQNFFEILPCILGLDARLQIIIELSKHSTFFNNLSEDDIIKISRNDYPSYLKELIGLSQNDSPPHSLIFTVR